MTKAILPINERLYFEFSILVHGSEEESFSPFTRAKQIVQEKQFSEVEVNVNIQQQP